MLILRRITDLRSWYIPRHRRRNILNPGSCKRGPAIFAVFVSTYETYARSKFLLSLLLPIRTTDLSDGNKRYCFKASLRIGLKDQMMRCFRKKREQKRDALLFAKFDPPYHNGNNSHPCHKETENSEKNIHSSNHDFAPLVSGKTGANEPSEETKSDERKSRPQKKTEQNGADHWNPLRRFIG